MYGATTWYFSEQVSCYKMWFFLTDHDWFVAKLKIAQIAMIDWFGGAKYIPVRDYLAYNYTGTEIADHKPKQPVGFRDFVKTFDV